MKRAFICPYCREEYWFIDESEDCCNRRRFRR